MGQKPQVFEGCFKPQSASGSHG